METKQKKMVLILGAHRSGTSLLAGCLEHLGLDLGKSCYDSDIHNPRGYFENKEIVTFNDRLLKHLNSCWENFLFDYDLYMATHRDTGKISEFTNEAIELIENNFSTKTHGAIKDPRMCQLLPFWADVLKRCGYAKHELFFIHIFRNPLEVSMSHQARSSTSSGAYTIGDTLEESIPLWIALNHFILRILRNGRHHQSLLLSHEQLTNSPEKTLARILGFIGLDLEPERINATVTTFVDKNLHRQKVPTKPAQSSQPITSALKIYQHLKHLSQKKQISSRELNSAAALLSISNNIDTITEAATPLMTKLLTNYNPALLNKIQTLEEQLNTYKVAHAQLIKALENR